jgi:hypothetical protein
LYSLTASGRSPSLLAGELAHAQAQALLHVAVEHVVDDELVDLAGLLPASRALALRLGELGEALDRLDPARDLGLARRELEAADGVAVRARRVAERALGRAQRRLQGGEALARILRRRDLDLQHAEQVLGVAVGLVEGAQRLGRVAPRVGEIEHRLERLAAALARRIEEQGLAVRIERAAQVVLVEASHVAEARVEAEAIAHVVGEGEVDLERLLEIVPALGLLVERLERGQRRPLRPELVEHDLPRADGLGHVAERSRQGLGGLGQGAAAIGRIGLFLLASAQDAHQLAVRRRALVQALERGERGEIGGVVVEALLPGDDGVRRIVEHRLVEAADALVERAALLHVGFEAHLEVQHLGEGLVLALGGADLRERLGRRDHQRGVLRIDREHAAVDLLGAELVLEEVLADARDQHEDLALGGGRGRGVGRGGEHGRDLLVIGEATPDLHEALARVGVLRLERDELGQGRERARVVAQALVAQDAHPAQQIAALGLIRSALATDLQHAHELPDLVLGLVDMLEHLGRAEAQLGQLQQALDELPRLGVALADREHVLEVLQGLRRRLLPIEVDAPEGELDVDGLLRGRRVEAALEQRGEILPALLALVELLQRVERRGVERVDYEDPLVVADGLAGVADDVLGDEGDLVEELDALLVVGGAGDRRARRGPRARPSARRR